MEISLIVARILSFITSLGLPGSLILLVVGVVIDIYKKKFRWSKFALIFLVVIVVLLIIQIKLTIQ